MENNFENNSKEGIETLLKRYDYEAITVVMTGDYQKVYERFLQRNSSKDRHPGHVVNDYYPREVTPEDQVAMSYEQYVKMVTERGMDTFNVGGKQIVLDTTEIGAIDREQVVVKIRGLLSM